MARYVTRLSHNPVDRRVLHGAFSRLEPCAVKVASTVLRGRGDGNVTLLPDGSDPSRPTKVLFAIRIYANNHGVKCRSGSGNLTQIILERNPLFS